jgi:hypothetical protein
MARKRPLRPDKHHRSVTLQETASFYGIRLGTARSTPALALRGQWLADAGFCAGQRVAIAVEYGRLTITVPSTSNRDA